MCLEMKSLSSLIHRRSDICFNHLKFSANRTAVPNSWTSKMKRLWVPALNCAKLRTSWLSKAELNAQCAKYLSVTCVNNNILRINHSPNDGENSNNFRHKSRVSGYACVGGLALVGLAIKFVCDKNESVSILPKISAAKPIDPNDAAASGGGLRSRFNFIADVVEKCASPVVYIEIKDLRRMDMFTKVPMTASNGSGFIVREDGLILTNAHVVINKPHSSVSVRLTNGQTYPGTVEEVDVQSDLATVRINCKNLPVMRLGKSSDLRPGEFVIAMGSPLSLSNTVTAGVVSTVNRRGNELGIKNKDMDYIQTDAAITFGNSGGPLVNLDGEAIGINSMKVAAGISFAIPIDYAKQFLERAEQNAKQRASSSGPKGPTRRYMGITMLSLTDDIIHQLQTRNHEIPPEVTHGVLVWKVVVGSPAHNGGLRPADIITHVDGTAVRSAGDIYSALERNGALALVVIRGLRRVDVRVVPEVY